MSFSLGWIMRLVSLAVGTIVLIAGSGILWYYVDEYRHLEDEAAFVANYYIFTLWVFIVFALLYTFIDGHTKHILVILCLSILTVHFTGILGTNQGFGTSFSRLTKLRGDLDSFTNTTSEYAKDSVRTEFAGGALSDIGMVIMLIAMTAASPAFLCKSGSASIAPSEDGRQGNTSMDDDAPIAGNRSLNRSVSMKAKHAAESFFSHRIVQLVILIVVCSCAVISLFSIWFRTSLGSTNNLTASNFSASLLITLFSLLLTLLFKNLGAAMFGLVYTGLFGLFSLGVGFTMASLASDDDLHYSRVAAFFGSVSALFSFFSFWSVYRDSTTSTTFVLAN